MSNNSLVLCLSLYFSDEASICPPPACEGKKAISLFLSLAWCIFSTASPPKTHLFLRKRHFPEMCESTPRSSREPNPCTSQEKVTS
jgi:hypothetical protein